MIAIIFGLHYSCKADLLKGVCKKKNSVNILIKIYNSGINTSILVRSQFQKHCCTINSTCVYLLYSCIENTLRVSALICYWSRQSSKPNNQSTCNMYSCVVLIAVIMWSFPIFLLRIISNEHIHKKLHLRSHVPS